MTKHCTTSDRCVVPFRHRLLATAVAAVFFVSSGTAIAQATNGTIEGSVSLNSGNTIQITGGAGINRTIKVDPSGHYAANVPVGTYTVSLLRDGQVVQSRTNVSPVAAGAVTVDFVASSNSAKTLGTVNVVATAIPPIDVSTTNQVITITAKKLEQLPLARNGESIAMLAPGVSMGNVMMGSGATGNPLLSFGGATVAENAYYIDGMNTTDSLTGSGGVTLPYGAIEQQQTFISGYGAQYGRSIGGVINQLGKSGSNKWHFGARAEWEPRFLRADVVNQLWGNPRSNTPGEEDGNLRTFQRGDHQWTTVYDAYASGPIIKDKLFFFVGAEADNTHFNLVQPISQSQNIFYRNSAPKLYAKVNWNINDTNILSVTGVQDAFKQWNAIYGFNNINYVTTPFLGLGQTTKNKFTTWVVNYTSYLTDNFTLHAMVGKMHGEYYVQQPGYQGFDPNLPQIVSASQQNPEFLPPGSAGISNSQNSRTIGDPAHRDTVMNYRVSLEYKWHNHNFTAGVDNIQTWDMNAGSVSTGPGYVWQYGRSDPATPLIGTDPNVAPYVGPPNSNAAGAAGYYVSQLVNSNSADVRVRQLAEYVEDQWQVTSNVLVTLGLRNDTFANFNQIGQAFANMTKPNWGPRFGFSWNVFGDASLKVFGNAGRYYIAMPADVSLRSAGNGIGTTEYFTYTGIDQGTGVPTGVQQIPQNNGGHTGMGVSVNNFYGIPLNADLLAATNLKAEYSDNFVAGLQWEYSRGWVAGVTGTFQKMGRVIDDWADTTRMCEAGVSEGLAYMTPATCTQWTQGSVLINPGETADLLVTSPSGAVNQIVVTRAQQGFQQRAKRNYYSLDLSLEHVWNGRWFARLDYIFARSYGNTEGPVESLFGQTNFGSTEQWDYAQLMEWSDGVWANNHKHTLKMYGAYAVNSEWTVGANLIVQTGAPNICLGYYGPNETDPVGYAAGLGGGYHWCGGVPAPPGSTGKTPTISPLAVTLDYRPRWAGHKLDFNVAVFNVFNEQRAINYFTGYGTTSTPFPLYHTVTAVGPFGLGDSLATGSEPPRMVRFTVSYDW